MGYHKVLFEKHWANSLGQRDGWEFGIRDEMVVWTYSAFDAKTLKYKVGYAKFPLSEFKEFFRKFLEEGKSSLTSLSPGSSISLEKKGGEVEIMVRVSQGDGIIDTLTLDEIPASLIQYL